MLRSYNQRAEREVDWRATHARSIATVARFSGVSPLVVGSVLSKKIYGGRVPVFVHGQHVGYA